jgi:DNA-binding MarR family transcriptional regulator
MPEKAVNQKYEIVWLIRRLFRAMSRESEHYLQNWELTPADRAVMEFLYPDHKLTVPSIARRYDVSRQHVQVTANRLLKMKMLLLETNPGHKRSRFLCLSVRGRECFREIRDNETAIVDRLFAGLPGSEIDATQWVLNSLLRKLSEDNPEERQSGQLYKEDNS